jgi:hypothetical protein
MRRVFIALYKCGKKAALVIQKQKESKMELERILALYTQLS